MIIGLTAGRGEAVYDKVIAEIKRVSHLPVVVERLENRPPRDMPKRLDLSPFNLIKERYHNINGRYVLVLVHCYNSFFEHDWIKKNGGEVWHLSISSVVPFVVGSHRFVTCRLNDNNQSNNYHKLAKAFVGVKAGFEQAELNYINAAKAKRPRAQVVA